MNKEFEKIIEKLESLEKVFIKYNSNNVADGISRAIEIVKNEAEQYNNGWIPCSVDLPKEKDGIVLISCEDGNVMTGQHSEFDDTWYKGSMFAVGGSNVNAWQPLPHPYQTKGE